MSSLLLLLQVMIKISDKVSDASTPLRMSSEEGSEVVVLDILKVETVERYLLYCE